MSEETHGASSAYFSVYGSYPELVCSSGWPGFCSLLLTSPSRQQVGEVSCCGQIPDGIGVNMAGWRRRGI